MDRVYPLQNSFRHTGQKQVSHFTALPGLGRKFDNWVAISQLKNGVNTVIQFDMSAPPSESGFLSVIDLNHQVELHFDTHEHPGDAELLSSTRTDQHGQDSTVEVIKTNMSIESVSDFYRSNYRGSGWKLVSDRPVREAQVLLFNKKNQKTEIVLTVGGVGHTVVVVNQVTYDK